MRRNTPRAAGRAAAALALCGGRLWTLARSAGAETAQWSGTRSGAWVRLFVDGQKATGGVEAAVGQGAAKLELAGAGTGTQYRGTLQGTAWTGERQVPVGGTWQASVSRPGGSIQLQVRTGRAQPVRLVVPLSPTAVQPLHCTWARGTVTRTPARGRALPLARGGEVRVGDLIQTGADGRAIVVLGDSSVVMMQEGTRLSIPEAPENGQRTQKVRVNSGKVWFAVRKVQEGEKFEVETDEVVAAVRGTEFLVEVEEGGETALTTAEGEVAVSAGRQRGATVPVTAGMRWVKPRGFTPRGPIQPVAHDLKALVRRWGPMLQEADRHWPYRRIGKPRFWQNRLGAAAPGGAPGPRRQPASGAPRGRMRRGR